MNRRIGKNSAMRRLGAVALLLVMVLGGTAGSPMAAPAAPASLEQGVRPLAAVDREGFVAVTAAELAADDADRAADGLPYRFALPVDLALTPANAGTWEALPDGRDLWRLRLGCPGALSLNVGFVACRLPASAALLIYPADDPTAARLYTPGDANRHGQVWTPVFLADELVVELQVAAAERDLAVLEIGSLGRGYRFFGEDLSAKSGVCNVDVVCAEGDAWRGEIATVGMVQRDGATLCTGFMVNNTAGDGRPLFMTAFHCQVDLDSAPSLVVYWNFESPACGQHGGGSLAQTSSGSTLLATYAVSDFTLLELDAAPDPAYGVKYAGWNRSSANPASAVCIHHPSTDEKSISFENDPTTTTAYLDNPGTYDPTAHIKIADWDVGTTEGGSSGSPLFDANHRVVGQLHGGYASCGNNLPDWFGRFSVSWEGGGTVTSRLRDHLDPDATGAVTVDLLDPLSGSFAVTPAGPAAFVGVAGGSFTTQDVSYTVSNSGADPVAFTAASNVNWLELDNTAAQLGDGEQLVVTASLTAAAAGLAPGTHRATLTFTNPGGGAGGTTREVVATVFANSLAVLGPRPNPFSNPPVTISYTLPAAGTVRALVHDINGRPVRDLGSFSGGLGENGITWDGRDNDGRRVASGLYVVSVTGLGSTSRVNVSYIH